MVKIDNLTLRRAHEDILSPKGTVRGQFARICVEVGVRKALVAKFSFNDQTYGVKYEGA